MNLGEKIQSLYTKFGSLKGVTIELHKQLIAVSVKNEAASATIFLQGAQLAEYKRIGEHPLIWLSDQCTYQMGKPLRGGIPICWPWFGDLARNPVAIQDQLGESDWPAHGFVRMQEWELISVELPDSETTRITLQLQITPDERWPFPAVLRVIISVGTTLDVQFQVTNLSAEPFSFTHALHTYFNVGNIESIAVEGLEGRDFLDTLDDWVTKKSNFPLQINAEVDRIYPNSPEKVAIIDRKLGRIIRINASNLPDLVVWNPWVEKSMRLSHFNDNHFKHMLCLESAALLDNAVTLAANETFKCEVNYGHN